MHHTWDKCAQNFSLKSLKGKDHLVDIHSEWVLQASISVHRVYLLKSSLCLAEVL
jgi:hypothetical protein